MIAPRLLPLSFVGFPLLFAACGGEGLTLPPEGEPARIEVLEEGNNQNGRVNEPLPELLVVRVTDSRGEPVQGREVLFSFVDGAAAGVPTPASARTNADGQASTTITLGSVAGTYTGTAQVQSAPGISAEFTVVALPADANGIRIFSGDPQSGTVNSPLPQPLVVLVTDANDNPIPNVAIQWTAEGGGTVSAESNVTDGNGQASVTRTLGGTAGTQTTRADAGQLAGSPVIFTHTATAGNAAGITKVSGDLQSGSPGAQLALPLIVEVRDELGNPIANRDVSWVIGVGGGSVSAQNTPTNAEGRATTNWTLGPAVGPNSVNAVVSGVGTATFTATATAGAPSAANSEVSAAPSTITAGSGSSAITVVVRDAGNNPVAGAAVTLASTGTGNSITPASASTSASGVATFTFSSTVGETKTITATASGVVIADQATVTVQKVSSNIDITDEGPDPSIPGQALEIEFVVTGANGGTPTGDVVVTMTNGPETCRTTLSGGAGACTLVPLEPGPAGSNNRRNITATYLGDAQFNGDAETENHRVIPAPAAATTTTITSDTPDPSDAGASITVSFTVTSGSGTPTGTVEVTAEGGGSCSATVAEGSCQLTPTAVGQTITLTATYQGTSAFSGSSDTEDHTVNAAPPANTAPTAGPDAYTSVSTQELRIDDPAQGVLANDTDAETPASIIARNPVATQGTVTLSPNGTFVYTPNGFGTGVHTFTYEVFDGELATTGTVTITMAAVRLK